MNSITKRKILLVDDDELIHQSFQLLFSEEYELSNAYNFSQALEILSREEIELVFIDLHFKPTNQKGSQFLKVLKGSYPELPAIMLSGDDSIDRVVECMRIGADDYLSKPFTKERIDQTLDKHLGKEDSVKKNLKTNSTDSILIGKSESMAQLKTEIARSQGLRILFVGETGVGKTPFARFSNLCIDQSGRRPFEQLNCASLSRERFQDELFGHKKGAFTGAIADKKGLVEIAEGGDLFLDEIGEMPLEVQALFLTFLDTMEFYRLGEDQKRKASVRILCATNRDLAEMVREGKFRKDLYSRISQVLIPIPPLRERTEDIELLISHFVKEFLGYEKPVEPELVNRFIKHSWTDGNVRELRDAIEYACIISKESDKIRSEHISRKIGLTEQADPSNATSSDPIQPGLTSNVDDVYDVGLEDYLTKIEKQVLSQLYKNHNKNVNELAESIRVSRPTLYRKLKKHSVLGS